MKSQSDLPSRLKTLWYFLFFLFKFWIGDIVGGSEGKSAELYISAYYQRCSHSFMPLPAALLHPASDGEFSSLLNISIAFKILSKLFKKKSLQQTQLYGSASTFLINMHRMEECHQPLLTLLLRNSQGSKSRVSFLNVCYLGPWLESGLLYTSSCLTIYHFCAYQNANTATVCTALRVRRRVRIFFTNYTKNTFRLEWIIYELCLCTIKSARESFKNVMCFLVNVFTWSGKYKKPKRVTCWNGLWLLGLLRFCYVLHTGFISVVECVVVNRNVLNCEDLI